MCMSKMLHLFWSKITMDCFILTPVWIKNWHWQIIYIKIVAANSKGYTEWQVSQAEEVCHAQQLVKNPSNWYCKNLILSNLLQNHFIMVNDIDAATHIFGPNLAFIRKKIKRQSFEWVIADYMMVPLQINELHQDITLYGNIFLINWLGFFVIKCFQITFITTEYASCWTQQMLANSLKRVTNFYNSSDFNVKTILLDKEFKCLCDLMRTVNMNTTNKDKHVDDTEVTICTIKE